MDCGQKEIPVSDSDDSLSAEFRSKRIADHFLESIVHWMDKGRVAICRCAPYVALILICRSITAQTPVPPPNDSSYHPNVITGLVATVIGSNAGATMESWEVPLAANASRRTVWWMWTSPTNATVTCDLKGSSFDAIAMVYAGSIFGPSGPVYPLQPAANTFSFDASADAIYWLAVDGKNGSSGDVVLRLQSSFDPPKITEQPADISESEGVSVSFRASVSGPGPLYYQWYFEEAPLIGTTSAIANVYLVRTNQTGNYSLTVSNAYGFTTSSNAYLRVVAAITNAPFAVSTLAGSTNAYYTGFIDGLGANVRFNSVFGVAVDDSGNLFVTDNQTIRKITRDGLVTTLAGHPNVRGKTDGSASEALFNDPSGISLDKSGNLYIADTGSHTIRKVTPAGNVSTVAGSPGIYGSADGATLDARFQNPSGVAVDRRGNLLVADTGNYTIRKITLDGFVTTLAGLSGSRGTKDAAGIAARFSEFSCIIVDSADNVYVTEDYKHAIRKIAPDGTVTTIAGMADSAGSADGPAPDARFRSPKGIAIDSVGNIFVADRDNFTLRRISTDGLVSTPAGQAGFLGSVDDIGSAAQFENMGGLAIDNSGVLYLTAGGAVRKGSRFKGQPVLLSSAFSSIGVPGEGTTFEPAVAGNRPMTFQWQNDSGPIGGATNSTLSISNLSMQNSGNYFLVASNSVGVVTNLVTSLQVVERPPNDDFTNRLVITGLTNRVVASTLAATGEYFDFPGIVTSHSVWWSWTAPTNQTAILDTIGSSTGTMMAVSTGSEPYQLIQVGYDYGSGTTSVVSFASQTGVTYNIMVAGGIGDVVLNLRCIPPTAPTIVQQPAASRTFIAGAPGSVFFSVNAIGSLPLSYQWYRDGQILPGATNSGLYIVNPQPTNAGIYTALVSNNSGSSMSSNSVLTVLPRVPNSTSSPHEVNALAGSTVTLTSQVIGSQPILLQWLFNGQPLPGMTNATLVLSNVTPDQAGRYAIAGSNDLGSYISFGTIVYVNVAPPNNMFTNRITISGLTNSVSGSNAWASTESGEPSFGYHASGKTVWWTWIAPTNASVELDTIGSSVSLNVAVFNGSAVSSLSKIAANFNDFSSFSSTNRIAFTAVAGTEYQIGVDSLNGSNATIVLNLRAALVPPFFIQQPQNVSLAANDFLNLSMSVSGTPPLFYQWTFNGTPLSGSTNYNLWLSEANTNNAGLYAVIASNNYGSVTSAVAVVKVTPPVVDIPLIITTVSGNSFSYPGAGTDGIGAWAQFYLPRGLTVDDAGNLFVADAGNNTIRRISTNGLVTTLAGLAGKCGSSNGIGSDARFCGPTGTAVDRFGNLYITDSGNCVVRKILPDNTVTILAGVAGVAGSADGAGPRAKFSSPSGIAIDSSGNLFVTDSNNHNIRRVSPEGVVVTIAGLAGVQGSADGIGSDARFSFPQGIAVDKQTNIFVADSGNSTVRKIGAAGNVTTIAGLAENVGSADGLVADARFGGPTGVSVDANGNVYVADQYKHTIRKITASGIVYTVAGGPGHPGNTDGPGAQARFNSPSGIALDNAGNFYVTDSANNTIRKGIVADSLLPPFNDSFANPATIIGLTNFALGSNLAATTEKGEPMLATNASGKTIWWNWVPPAHALATITVLGTGFPAIIQVFTGNDMKKLSPVTPWWVFPEQVSFDAQPGVTYRIVADGTSGSSGNIGLRISAALPTPPIFSSSVGIQSADEIAEVGGLAEFSDGASGWPSPTYQWLFNGNPLAGQTNNWLQLPNVQLSQAGYYSIVASNEAGVSVSQPARLIFVPHLPAFIVPPGRNTFTNGFFKMSLATARGSLQLIVISASTNLVDWEILYSGTYSGGPLEFYDKTGKNFRFYRAETSRSR